MSETRQATPWWLRLVSVAAVIGLVASTAELVLRLVIPHVVAQEVREQLSLEKQHEVHVSLGGSALFAALGGHVGPIEVQVPAVRILDDIVATVTASASELSFDPLRDKIFGASGSVTIGPDSIDALLALATEGLIDSGEVEDGRIQLGSTSELFGQTVTLSATLGMSIEDGDLRLTPAAISAAGFHLTAEEIDALTDGALDALLSVQHVCVRDRLPAGVTLTGLWFSASGSVTVNADFSPDILSDPRQQQPGTCLDSSG